MSGEINKSIPVQKAPILPAFESDEAAPKILSKTVAPPEYKTSAADKKAAETTLPGSNASENLSNTDIKATVGEIVSDLAKNDAWETAANSFQDRLLEQTQLDDASAINDPINQEWSQITGAKIAQFADIA